MPTEEPPIDAIARPLDVLRRKHTDEDVMNPLDDFPPLPELPAELAFYPSNPEYTITVYHDITRNFRDDDLERILTEARARYPDRSVYLAPLDPSSLEYFSLSPFPEMERRFKADGYVADVEGRLFGTGGKRDTEFFKRNFAALRAHAMAMATILEAHPRGFIAPDPDDEVRKEDVYQVMGPIFGNKSFDQEGGLPAEPLVYPLVEYQGMLLGCTDFRQARRIHWALETSPKKAVEHGEREYARKALFGLSTEETKAQVLFEASHARRLFSPHLLDPTAAAVVTDPTMIITWYSQAIAAIRKVCWLVRAEQETSVAAQSLYEEAQVHGNAIGNPRLPRNHRTWDDLIIDLVHARTGLIVRQCAPVLAANEMTHEISRQNENLAALLGSTYDSQADCMDSPFETSEFIRHLAYWIGALKRTRVATLDAYTALSIIELWENNQHSERLLLSQFPRTTWERLVEVSLRIDRNESPESEVTYTWTTNPARPYGYAEEGNRISLDGPLLCYPALDANQWRENARIILGLRGFLLER